MKKYVIALLLLTGILGYPFDGESYGYQEVGLPKWHCLNCGRQMQAYTPPQYGCPRGQYNRHSWVRYR